MKSEKIGIFSAVFASVCCLGPLLLILLGLGSLGITAMIGKYHWWFLGLGALLIIFAWGYYFREKKACDLKSCRMENKTKTLIILTTATLIVAFFMVLNLYTYFIGRSEKPSKVNAAFSRANLETVIIPVKGMTCFTCEVTVSSALKKVDGVVGAAAYAKDGKAKVSYDPSETDIKELIEAINKTGYKASLPE